MDKDGARLKSLIDNLSSMVEQNQQRCLKETDSMRQLISVIQTGNNDSRLRRLDKLTRQLAEGLETWKTICQEDFLDPILEELVVFQQETPENRIQSILQYLIEEQVSQLDELSYRFLDGLILQTKARRGFILFWMPESSEAEIIAARNYQSTNLSIGEYQFSRTLVQEALTGGKTVLVQDAFEHPLYSSSASVRDYKIRSVIAAPFRHLGRVIGAIYLENHNLGESFNSCDAMLLESIGKLYVFFLHMARFLPLLIKKPERVVLESDRAVSEIVGRDPGLCGILRMVERIADSPATVLIEGESGTGKELIARALHFQSSRQNGPFVAINCAAIPEELMESELFGYEKGAFTGAADRFVGRLEQGHGGTIFLDEIGDLAYPLQSKLLRFLQSGEFRRLGGKGDLEIDVRVVAATSRELKTLIGEGLFQKALYYRLNVIPLQLPPLRDRKSDIPLLIDHFKVKYQSVYQRTVKLEDGIIEILTEYDFPGNVRELENLVHRLIALCPGDTIGLEAIPDEIIYHARQKIALADQPLLNLLRADPGTITELRQIRQKIKSILDEKEKNLVREVISTAGGNISEAAKELGIHRVTLHKMLKK